MQIHDVKIYIYTTICLYLITGHSLLCICARNFTTTSLLYIHISNGLCPREKKSFLLAVVLVFFLFFSQAPNLPFLISSSRNDQAMQKYKNTNATFVLMRRLACMKGEQFKKLRFFFSFLSFISFFLSFRFSCSF